MNEINFLRWQVLLTPEAHDFISKFQQTPIDKVALQKPKFPHIPFPEAVEQLDSIRKCAEKMPAWATKTAENLLLLPSLAFQQASSTHTAQFKSTLIKGAKIADLTGGLGIDTYFLAQEGRQVWHIEAQADLQAIVQHNFKVLEQKNVIFCPQTAEDFIAQTPERFDALYIDPSRRGKEGQKLVLLEDYSPNIHALLPAMLQKAHDIWLKTSPLLDIGQASQKLEKVKEVYVITHANEVKELLFHLTAETYPDTALTFHAVTLRAGKAEIFTFTKTEEQNALPTYSAPLAYLYEPLPALMKAGAFKIFAERFGVHKLHTNTHLYTSADLKENLPARTFKILGIFPYKKNTLPTRQANITVRNFRDTVAQIRQKLGVAEGGEQYVFATTLSAGEQVLILCEK